MMNPVYLLEGRFHSAVGNVPGSVPRTSMAALANATLSYVVELADSGVRGAMEGHPELKKGINVEKRGRGAPRSRPEPEV